MSKERDAYVEKFKAQLDQLNAKIDAIEAKANEAKADARIKHEKELDQLRARRDAARSRLDELRTASGDAWHDLKGGFERSWDAFSDAVKHAVERFE
jgi:predicted  nucleic acid-binding Zn-ribbon protein